MYTGLVIEKVRRADRPVYQINFSTTVQWAFTSRHPPRVQSSRRRRGATSERRRSRSYHKVLSWGSV